ncbi:NUDIX domain-containing protein [Streptomyces sp. NPDC004111]|uniref:NUDIX domain-containing protein n=1 Tax=Streptomyces sp. NPDC004111 TaxID=3364690 RepID=UPI0036B1443D
MSEMEKYSRRAARVLLFDAADRLLLLKFRVDPDVPAGGHGWCAPGGGLEDGESEAEAAARELREEIGLAVTPEAVGPKVALTAGYADLGWAEGMFQDNFFHLRVTGHQVDVSGQGAEELRYHAGHRWWTLDELAASTERIHPLGLSGLARDLVAGRIPAEPVRLPWHH